MFKFPSEEMYTLGVSADRKAGWLTERLADMGLSRAKFAVLLTDLGAVGGSNTIAKRLRRWDLCEAPPTDEVLALLTLLGRIRGALGGVCGAVPAKRSVVGRRVRK
jgi:hypothetical protein